MQSYRTKYDDGHTVQSGLERLILPAAFPCRKKASVKNEMTYYLAEEMGSALYPSLPGIVSEI